MALGDERPAWLDELIVALDREGDSKWGTGDVLVRRTHPHDAQASFSRKRNGASEQFRNVASHLASAGYDVSERLLRDRYITSRAFPVESRHPHVSWTVHRLMAESGMADAPRRLLRFLSDMQEKGKATSRRNAEEWLGRAIAADSAEATARKVGGDAEKAREVIAEVANRHPDVVADVAANLAPVETNAAVEQRQKREGTGGDPRQHKRDREDERLRKYGAGFVEVLEASELGDEARDVAAKFVTPESGARYNDNAVTVVEAATAKMRAAADHMEQVVRGEIDTRIPSDLSGLVVE